MDEQQNLLERKKQNLFIALTAVFLTNALLAELIGAKVFSLEKTLGIAPANIGLLGGQFLDFNLSAGVVIWPVVFIVTDIVNEYFGKSGVRKISLLAALCVAYSFTAIFVASLLPPADFWIEVNKNAAPEGNFNINTAFGLVYRQGMGIIIGSLSAFAVGQFTDVYVFQKLRKFSKGKSVWLRATGSTLVSQLIDSYIVLFIAFYVFGNWTFELVISVGIINYAYKTVVAVLITPVLYVVHALIGKYLGKANAEKMAEEASVKTFF